MKTYQKVPGKTQREKGHPEKDCKACWGWRRGLIGKVLSAFGKRINWNWAPPMALIRIWCAVNGGTKRGRRAMVEAGGGEERVHWLIAGLCQQPDFWVAVKVLSLSFASQTDNVSKHRQWAGKKPLRITKKVFSRCKVLVLIIIYSLARAQERGGGRGMHINI